MSFRPDSNDIRHWSVARRFIAGVAAVLSSIVVTHGLAAVLRHLGPVEAPLAAVGLTLAAAVVAVAVVALQLVHPGAWARAASWLALLLVDLLDQIPADAGGGLLLSSLHLRCTFVSQS